MIQLTIVTLVGSVSGLVKSNHGIPCLILQSHGYYEVVCCEIKVLLHIRESQSGTLVVILRIQWWNLVHDFVFNGREENAKVFGDISSGINTRIRLTIFLTPSVAKNHRTGEIESVLVELGLI